MDLILKNKIISLASKSQDDTSYAMKVKEIQADRDWEELRIKFQLWNKVGAKTAYGRIYLNGSPLGTEQTVVGTTPDTKSEDFTGGTISNGDLIQMYIKTESGGQAGVNNFRFYGYWQVDAPDDFTDQ